MRNQACEPCAKRKVRCDRTEPCSNCKRRKRDHCVYPEVTPIDRIKRLEALVRSLGGDPDSNSRTQAAGPSSLSPSELRHTPPEASHPTVANILVPRTADAAILEQDGQRVYIESRAWQGWLSHDQSGDPESENAARVPFRLGSHPNAFQNMLCGETSVDLARDHPTQQGITVLWEAFYHQVNPVVRIFFSWALRPLQYASSNAQERDSMTDIDYALLRSIYLVSVVSLSEESCQREFSQSRSSLVLAYQAICEGALFRTNILCMVDIKIFKACILYLMAGADRLSTHSLWSLMGLIVRNAERLGMHRDGAGLSLSPVDTEERRRVWWQLQHLDLNLAVKCGTTPLTMTADWDASLPLNIEDEDIDADTATPPSERRGLTSMSYCLFTYWVIDQQRRFSPSGKNRFQISWQSTPSTSSDDKQSLVNRIEEGVNEKFLRYCDPINPVDILLQLVARFLVCGLRLRVLHPLRFSESGEDMDSRQREELLAACVQTLRYNIALNTQPAIGQFRWYTKSMFPWHSLMCVLVEVSQQHDAEKIRLIWGLLSDLYAANSTLTDLSEDRRTLHAARHVVTAWKACQIKLRPRSQLNKPNFVTLLESRLAGYNTESTRFPSATAQSSRQENDLFQVAPVTPESLPTPRDVDTAFDLDFEDIDWSFWSSVD